MSEIIHAEKKHITEKVVIIDGKREKKIEDKRKTSKMDETGRTKG